MVIDPNEKLGAVGYGPQAFIIAETTIPYRINFENLGPGSVPVPTTPATAPAQRVDVTDALSTLLDWESLEFTGFGWGDTIMAVPAGLSYYFATVGMTLNGKFFNVEVELNFDKTTGKVLATFQSVDPATLLPPDVLTGFLPPEDGTDIGKAFVSFTVKPDAGLPSGTALRNIAQIRFDFQDVIATNQIDPQNAAAGTDPNKEALNTIDAGTPTSSVFALPAASTTLSFPVTWSGSDDANGSGIARYDVYVSDNSGPFTLWLEDTTDTSSTFPGLPGHRYAFYSIATDNVGHTEDGGTEDAMTFVEPSVSVSGTAGDNAFTLTYSAVDVTISVVTSGKTTSLGSFALDRPITLDGLGGTDSVKVVGTNGADVIQVSGTGLQVNGASLILDNTESLTLVGGAGDDTYRFDADDALGLITLDEALGGIDTLDFSLTLTQNVALNLGLAPSQSQVVNLNLSLILKSGAKFENVLGGFGNDTLIGNNLANVLRGGVGNDTLTGLNGNDLLEGGAGNDFQDGGSGNDTYLFVAQTDTALGSDTLTDAQGNDTISYAGSTVGVIVNLGLATPQTVHSGAVTDDVFTLATATMFENLIGGDGNDVLTGNTLANVLQGSRGDDILSGDSGNDTLEGGAGDDSLAGGIENDVYLFVADEDLGNDSIADAIGVETISFAGTVADVSLSLGLLAPQSVNAHLILTLDSVTAYDRLIGGDGNDTLTGNTGVNHLTGGAGNDTLAGGTGNDTYIFDADLILGSDMIVEAVGAGTDSLSFTQTKTTAVSVSLGTPGPQVVVAGNLSIELMSDAVIENITGGSLGDTLTGNSLANSLTGGPGDDILNGGSGNDKLNGGLGNDLLIGGADDDTYTLDADTALGTDTIDESGGGIDTLDFTSTTTRGVTVDLAQAVLQDIDSDILTTNALILGSATSIENVKGGSLADILTGNALANRLTGNAGDDTLNGVDGEDLLIGNAGNDALNGGNGNDRYQFDADVVGGLGSDTISDVDGVDVLDFRLTTFAGLGITLDLAITSEQVLNANLSLTLQPGTEIETVLGTSQDDIIRGNSASNIFVGNAGNDELDGRDGRDILIGGIGADDLFGGNDDDLLIAGRTVHDALIKNLNDIRTEWTLAIPSDDRVTALRAGVGLSVVSLKKKIDVRNDGGADDTLTGGAGQDWFFRAVDDAITDLFDGETLDLL